MSAKNMVSRLTEAIWNDWSQLRNKEAPANWSWHGLLEKHKIIEKCFKFMDNVDELSIENIFSCQFCSDVIDVPFTLQCGCTLCKSCQESDVEFVDSDQNCLVCSRKSYLKPKTLKVNVVLSSFISKWFTDYCSALRLRKRGHSARLVKDFDTALNHLDESVKVYPGSLNVWKERASILFELERSEEALESIEKACHPRSHLCEVYQLKGTILHTLGRDVEAVVALLVSIVSGKQKEGATELLNEVMMDITHKTTFNQTSRIEGLCPMDTDAYDDDPGVSFQSSSSDIVFKDKLQKILEKFDDEINALNNYKDSSPQFKSFLTPEQLEQLGSEFECNLCSRLLYEPVTTPCGHVFCKDCLRRWLDHNHSCPMCRFSLFEFVAVLKLEASTLIEKITKTFFPKEIEKRASCRIKELEELARVATETDEHIPVFVCCIALPTRPLQMQIFEPRYRLMLRQCLESGSRQFGICPYCPDNGFADYGTMVEIRNAYFVPDGRAFIECWGGRRFQVLSRGVKDGYNTAKVDWIKDASIPTELSENIVKLNNEVYSEMKSYINEFFAQRNRDISGLLQVPDAGHEKVTSQDGPDWIWWFIDCFLDSVPLQLTMIGTRTLEGRLNFIRKHLELNRM